ncbi:MAG: delta-60 repeat domain-containing protein, partial [Flavobacteriales bacterium]|nr:delta-60 repeat domain-containing protein [Flavobacteriales bacterium]
GPRPLLGAFIVVFVGSGLFAQDGALDLSFDPGTGFNHIVTAIEVQPDGKILAAGLFTSYNGTSCDHITRLNANGSLDGTFTPGSGANGSIYAMVLQPDGKILIAGTFTTYNGTERIHLARLNSNGTLDGTFVHSLTLGESPDVIVLQPDGNILLGSGSSVFVPRRLTSIGSLDSSFGVGTGFAPSNGIEHMLLQPDGRILVGGQFGSYNGTPRGNILRLNQNGSLDSSFDPGSGASAGVYALARQPDGKIMIGGGFISYDGTSRQGVARIHPDGSLDMSFDAGTFSTTEPVEIWPIAAYPDGKVLISGAIALPPLFTRRLNDGSVDNTFSGTPNVPSWCSALQPDGKILIGGGFFTYNGTNRSKIARINGTARARIKVLLEGPYSTGQMTDALRTLPSFPLVAPFTAMGYAETVYVPGAAIHSSTLSATGNNAIVDWVIVEMRPAATPNLVAASRAVLLQRDGDVVDLDGISSVGFGGLAHGNYCVVVKPRNHLPVMLSPSTPFAYGTATSAVDFTLPTTQVYDNDARKNVSGVMLLRAGDVTFNEVLQYVGAGNDRDPILVRIGGSTPTTTVSGYFPEDVNMDGVVKYVGAANDRDPILLNIGGSTPSATLAVPLP